MALQMVPSGRTLKLVLLVLAFALGVPPATAAPECRIAVLGDSLTAGYGLELEDAFPAELERALRAEGYACDVLDAGVSGDTTAGGRSRLDWMLGDEPSHVIVELGGNDGLRALPPEQMEDNLGAILTRLEGEGIPTLLAGMLAPPNLGQDYGRDFRSVFERLAESHEVAFYPFFLDGVAGQPELNQPDRIHPNEAGVDEIVRRILPTVIDWLHTTGIPSESASVPPDASSFA
ncbi:MAG: arylesterase [Geminicoccaceae bacterium]|nr:arylesterase [Geminicoccaceae bacterium]